MPAKFAQPLNAPALDRAWADIQIAAIAKSNGPTLITGNVRHFSWIAGLHISNWLENTAV